MITSHWLDAYTGNWASVYLSLEEINDGAIDYLMMRAAKKWAIFGDPAYVELHGEPGWRFLLCRGVD